MVLCMFVHRGSEGVQGRLAGMLRKRRNGVVQGQLVSSTDEGLSAWKFSAMCLSQISATAFFKTVLSMIRVIFRMLAFYVFRSGVIGATMVVYLLRVVLPSRSTCL